MQHIRTHCTGVYHVNLKGKALCPSMSQLHTEDFQEGHQTPPTHEDLLRTVILTLIGLPDGQLHGHVPVQYNVTGAGKIPTQPPKAFPISCLKF